MTTLPDATAAISAAVLSAMATAYPGVPVDLENEDFDMPTKAPWVRCTIRHGMGGPETLGGQGNRRFTRTGLVLCQVFQPQNAGRFYADTMARVLMGVFEGVTLAGTTVSFGNVTPHETGAKDGWFCITVEAAFTYDEIK